MGKWGISLWLLAVLLVGRAAAQEETRHLHYFETVDIPLTDPVTYQLFSFAALQDEAITIVAYGLDAGVVPSIALFDHEGRTLTEDRNLDQHPTSVVQAGIPHNGVYTFLVSRQTTIGGAVRVMLFAGDPLQSAEITDSLTDEMIGRAYLVGGDTVMSLNLLTEGTEIYASRATKVIPPTLGERTTPIEGMIWQNTEPETLYTLSLFAVPPLEELLPFQLTINGNQAESETISLPSICWGEVEPESLWRMGPTEDYALFESPDLTKVEIAGENGDYYVVVNPHSPTGDSWILQDSVTLTSDKKSCGRVQEVPAPILTPENSQRR